MFIPGPGGTTVPVTRDRTCPRTINRTCDGPIIGYNERTECIENEVVGYTETPVPPTVVDGIDDIDEFLADNPNAQNVSSYDVNETVDQDFPGAVADTRTDTVWISEDDSIIEVNGPTDTNNPNYGNVAYQIPFPRNADGSFNTALGVMVNGTRVTDPNDPVLTVPEGKTVYIDHDSSANGVYYGEFTILEGRTNGIVFSDNNIWDLQGTNKGALYEDADGDLAYQGRTIATNLSRDIEIQGDILQYYDGTGTDESGNPLNNGNNRLVEGNLSPDPSHILGIVAQDIWIDVNDRSSRYRDDDSRGALDVYAVLMAGARDGRGTDDTSDDRVTGGFGVRNNDMQNNDGVGLFRLYGGLITGNMRRTQTADINAGDTNGFEVEFNYDWIASQSLKNFPSTQNFSVLRYVEMPVL